MNSRITEVSNQIFENAIWIEEKEEDNTQQRKNLKVSKMYKEQCKISRDLNDEV